MMNEKVMKKIVDIILEKAIFYDASHESLMDAIKMYNELPIFGFYYVVLSS